MGGGGNQRSLTGTKRKRGFTLTEMILVLAVGALLISGVFYVYKTRIEPSRWVENKMQAFNSLVAALETAKAAKGGTYPASDESDLSNISDDLIKGVVGNNAADLAGWTYNCPPGTGVTMSIGIWIGDRPNDEIVNVLLERVRSTSPFDGAYYGGNLLTVSRDGVICN